MAIRLVLSINQLLKTGIEFGNNHHLHLAYNFGMLFLIFFKSVLLNIGSFILAWDGIVTISASGYDETP